MMREIKESDWKILRLLHSVALERFCHQTLLEIERINSDNSKSFHQKYLEIYEVTRQRDKEVAQTFNDLRRSTAFTQLAAMKARGLLTEDESLRFSQETQVIALLLGTDNDNPCLVTGTGVIKMGLAQPAHTDLRRPPSGGPCLPSSTHTLRFGYRHGPPGGERFVCR